jgi:predicted dehydrogenase
VFGRAVAAAPTPAIGFDDGRRALAIADAAVASAKSGAPVTLER